MSKAVYEGSGANNLTVVQLQLLGSCDRDLANVEQTPLIAPIERQANAFGQKLG